MYNDLQRRMHHFKSFCLLQRQSVRTESEGLMYTLFRSNVQIYKFKAVSCVFYSNLPTCSML